MKLICAVLFSLFAAMSQACEVNEKLLNAIREFNLTVFYSYEQKGNDVNHPRTGNPKFYTKKNDAEISDKLYEIKNMFLKKANPNSQQFLHEAVFLYFIYRDLELSKFHKYHDSSEPNNQLKLIKLLLDFGAHLSPYEHPHLGGEYELLSLRCFSNLQNQLYFGKGLSPKRMDGLSPLEYAAKFQEKYPEMFALLSPKR